MERVAIGAEFSLTKGEAHAFVVVMEESPRPEDEDPPRRLGDADISPKPTAWRSFALRSGDDWLGLKGAKRSRLHQGHLSVPRDPNEHPEDEERLPSPESREFEAVAWELGRLLQSSSSIDWQDTRSWSAEVLSAYAARCEKSRSLTAKLEGSEYLVGGAEHYLLQVDGVPDRIFKVTYGDNFGCKSYFCPLDPDLTGRNFHATGNDDAIFYLRRWILLNSIGPHQTSFEGFLPPLQPGWVPSICVSQPKIQAMENPNHLEIRQSLGRLGFVKISEDAFLCPKTYRLLTDTAPRNVRIIDGIPFALDAIAEIASDRVINWFHELFPRVAAGEISNMSECRHIDKL